MFGALSARLLTATNTQTVTILADISGDGTSNGSIAAIVNKLIPAAATAVVGCYAVGILVVMATTVTAVGGGGGLPGGGDKAGGRKKAMMTLTWELGLAEGFLSIAYVITGIFSGVFTGITT